MFGLNTSSSFVTPPINTSITSIRENTVWNGTLSTLVCVFIGALSKGFIGTNKFEVNITLHYPIDQLQIHIDD